jgi:hypothetical protein
MNDMRNVISKLSRPGAKRVCLPVSLKLHHDTVQDRLRRRGKKTLTVSMSFLLSSNADLSFMSLLATHVLIWSRNRWSFLIWVFKSVSSFSFCVWFVDDCILSYILSKSSTPSDTFLSVRSISADESRHNWYQNDGALSTRTLSSLWSFLAAMANSEKERNNQNVEKYPQWTASVARHLIVLRNLPRNVK